MSTDTIVSQPQHAVHAHLPTVRTRPKHDRALAAPLTVGTNSGLPTVFCYAASDALSIFVALAAVRGLLAAAELAPTFRQFEPRLAIGFAVATMIVNWYQGLYSSVVLRPAAELKHVWISALTMAGFFVALQWMMDLPSAHASLLIWMAGSSILVATLLPILRAGCRILFGRCTWWGRRVLLVGCGEKSSEMFSSLAQQTVFGLRPVGYVEDIDQLGDNVADEGYLGSMAELVARIADSGVTLGLVASNGASPRNEIAHLVCRPNTGIIDWLIVSDCAGLPCLWTSAREVAGMPALGLSNRLRSPWRRALKRGFDLLIVALVSPLLVPIIALIALLVKISSPGGKAFYASERIGRDGRRFRMWKLRTMVPNADAVLKDYLAKNPQLREEYERDHKLKQDPRVLWLGDLVRKASLDELPQIWNIFTGEMSIVGPRPMLVNELEKYGDTYEEYRLVPPGITGMWQVNGRNNTTYEERLKYTDYYVKNWSLWLDIYILFCTIKVVLLREGAY